MKPVEFQGWATVHRPDGRACRVLFARSAGDIQVYGPGAFGVAWETLVTRGWSRSAPKALKLAA